jgi:hypothetical protein
VAAITAFCCAAAALGRPAASHASRLPLHPLPAPPAPQNTEFTIKLKQLEDELLFKLSTAEGDITGGAWPGLAATCWGPCALARGARSAAHANRPPARLPALPPEDVALIESLEESKRVATDISDKVAEARETETAINDSRNKCAPRGGGGGWWTCPYASPLAQLTSPPAAAAHLSPPAPPPPPPPLPPGTAPSPSAVRCCSSSSTAFPRSTPSTSSASTRL